MKEKHNIKFSEFKLVISLIVKHYRKFNIDYSLLTKQIVQQNILSNESDEINSLCKKLDEIQEKFCKTIDDNFYKVLFKDDIKKLKDIITDDVQNFDLENLLNISGIALETLNNQFNTNISQLPEIFIVDNFPKPYNEITTWDFMYASKEDEEKYNIKEGLYIHTERQFPVYCEYLIIHELVHYFIDQLKKEKETKYRWIEEAIANWFAFIVHYNAFNQKNFISYIKNVNTLYNQIFPYSVIAEYSYYDNIFRKIFHIGGHDGIINFCKDYIERPNDEIWATYFESILNNEFELINKYNSAFAPKNEMDFLLFDSNSQTHILNLTSLEFIIIKSLTKEGITKIELSKKTEIPLDYIEKGIKQLQNRGYIIIQEEKIEIIDNVLHLFESDLIKVSYQWKSGYSN